MATALTAAQQVERDIAEFLAHHERPHTDWLPVLPASDARELVAGYEVLPHVQAFADAVRVATKVKDIGTYPGHSPSIDRALDLFHAVRDTALADAISDFAIKHQARYGVRYVIDRQQIWHRLDPVWRWMEDRGDNTQNHYDHNHISFETEAAKPAPAPEPPKPEPQPQPVVEGVPMVVQLACEGEDWLYDSPGRIMYRITAPVFDVLKACDVPRVEVDREVLTEFQNVARNAKFTG